MPRQRTEIEHVALKLAHLIERRRAEGQPLTSEERGAINLAFNEADRTPDDRPNHWASDVSPCKLRHGRA